MQQNYPPFGYVHQQNVYSPPLAHGAYLDGGVMHHPYPGYGPEYYPGPMYPMYPDEEYYPSQIHVNLFKFLAFRFIVFFCLDRNKHLCHQYYTVVLVVQYYFLQLKMLEILSILLNHN